jgi:hypothetical protein|tara:strand:- start:504 stop:671 length:168 start_codon:yes stop_codon:yes gene_type:complete
MIKEYTSTITLTFGCNNFEAESKEEYINQLKENFLEEYGIELRDDEISIDGDTEE